MPKEQPFLKLDAKKKRKEKKGTESRGQQFKKDAS